MGDPLREQITLRSIPEEAYRYTLGGRSVIEWTIDRYWVKTNKASVIMNHPNDWSRQVGRRRYIIDLMPRIDTVSLATAGALSAPTRRHSWADGR